MGPVTIISSYRAGRDSPQQMPGLTTEDTESPHCTGAVVTEPCMDEGQIAAVCHHPRAEQTEHHGGNTVLDGTRGCDMEGLWA
ncbi:hypothetical protein E2I00_018709 [Balaenoptera physalus]|uniref:Uncharacterized protein n=1 Tax=Balaenoptera physalus TaxID=9770 RepID=A0A6A1QJQ6_BALPH|nr:hypothetical protein E2I00_018709 [Balaenoptera physalus]